MDTSRAEALVGVRDILKYSDPDIAEENGNGADTAYYYNILALPGISDFYQHPMGIAVVADSEELCDQALNLIEIKWEERPFIRKWMIRQPTPQRLCPKWCVNPVGGTQYRHGR
jgi:hypothetical protein